MTSFAGLPTRQVRCLHAIIRLIEDTGMSPTLEEIATAMECTRQYAHVLVGELVAKKRIKRDPGKHRSIIVVEKKDEKLIKKNRRT